MHLIQISGKAARRVSPEFRQGHAGIPWTDSIGMRHVVVHDYLRVDEDIVWQVATADLPQLVAGVEPILASGETPP